jgi:hypothetical protein
MNQNEELRIPLTNTLIQAIGDYLISRPYREVAVLINSLQMEVTAATTVKPNGVHENVEVVGDLQ